MFASSLLSSPLSSPSLQSVHQTRHRVGRRAVPRALEREEELSVSSWTQRMRNKPSRNVFDQFHTTSVLQNNSAMSEDAKYRYLKEINLLCDYCRRSAESYQLSLESLALGTVSSS